MSIKHPMWMALGAGLVVVLLAFAPSLWHLWRGPVDAPSAVAPSASATAAEAMLPWQVQAVGEGRSRVFGLLLGGDRLAELSQRFGDTLQLGVVARYDEPGALEAMVEPMNAGFVQGRLVVGFEVPDEAIARWRARSTDQVVMGGGVRRFQLSVDDLAEAQAMPIASLSFIPALRLSEADVRERFGPPAERRALANQTEALLYPERGVLALVQPGSRGLLQYVAPAVFDARLRAPLPGASAPSAAR